MTSFIDIMNPTPLFFLGWLFVDLFLLLGVIWFWSQRKPKRPNKQPTAEMIESLEVALAVAKLRLGDTLEELSATKAELRECQLQLAEANEQIDELAHARSQAESTRDQLHAKNADLRDDLAAANQKLEFVEARLREMQTRLGTSVFREHADQRPMQNGAMPQPPTDQRRTDFVRQRGLRRRRRTAPWTLKGTRPRDVLMK